MHVERVKTIVFLIATFTCNRPSSICTEDEIKIMKYGLEEEDVPSSLLEKSDLMEEENPKYRRLTWYPRKVKKMKRTLF